MLLPDPVGVGGLEACEFCVRLHGAAGLSQGLNGLLSSIIKPNHEIGVKGKGGLLDGSGQDRRSRPEFAKRVRTRQKGHVWTSAEPGLTQN